MLGGTGFSLVSFLTNQQITTLTQEGATTQIFIKLAS